MSVQVECWCDGDDCEVVIYPTYHTEDDRSYCGGCYDSQSEKIEELTELVAELRRELLALKGEHV